MFKRIVACAAVAASLAVAVPAHAEELIPQSCEDEAAAFIDARGGTTGYGAACYSEAGFHGYCVFFQETRTPDGGNTRTCYVPVPH